jgi:hypothetical protein
MKLIDTTELSAILAGLRMLQDQMDPLATASDVSDILTNGGTQEPITVEGIDRLCDLLNRPDELRT